MAETQVPQNQRLATIEQLQAGCIGVHFNPIPTVATLRNWLTKARIPRFKTNAAAVRGGGVCYYSVPHVERLICAKLFVK